MVQPINYSIDIPDPTKAFLESFKVGSVLVEQEQMQAQRQAAQAQQAQFQAGLNSFFAKPAADRTFEELQPLLIGANKQQFDALTAIGNNMNTERKEEAQKFAAKISFALRNNPEVASVMLQERIDATKDQNQKRILQIKLDKAIIDPIAAANEIETLGAATFGKAWFEGISAANAESRLQNLAPSALLEAKAKADKAVADAIIAQATATNATEKAAADAAKATADAQKAQVDARFAEQMALADLKNKAANLGLTQAQTASALAQTKKLSQETQKIALELEALRATGGIDQAKTFEQEDKLRKEYQSRTKVYGELGITLNNIQSSAGAKTGSGDIALIIGFMKMLEPDSVVRETEYATARDTAGLYTRLENSLKKAQSGQFLQPKQREEYVNLAREYYNSAQKKAEEDKKALGVVVKNYRLNPDNVFGPETAAAAPAANSVRVGNQTYTRPANFTDAQWSAYKQSVGAK